MSHLGDQWTHFKASIKQRWHRLTDEDIEHGVKHRRTLLQSIADRHGLGMDEANAQLREFEERNPSFKFERME